LFNGQIDVIGGVNLNNHANQVVLHTNNSCLMSGKRKQTGTTIGNDCCDARGDSTRCGLSNVFYNYTRVDAMTGCNVTEAETAMNGTSPNAISFKDFNNNRGGIMAVEWRDAGIRVWSFARDRTPINLQGYNLWNPSEPVIRPNPNSWGKAVADFPSTYCDMASHFKDSRIIIDVGLCGEGTRQPNVLSWTYESECPASCQEYISRQTGSDYREAYWEFGGIWVFQGQQK
jgi:hypothetical protein